MSDCLQDVSRPRPVADHSRRSRPHVDVAAMTQSNNVTVDTCATVLSAESHAV